MLAWQNLFKYSLMKKCPPSKVPVSYIWPNFLFRVKFFSNEWTHALEQALHDGLNNLEKHTHI